MTTRGRRRLLWSLLLVLVGLVAALFAGPMLLDQERYRGILISRVGQLLNRTVTASSLRAHLLPSPGVTIQNFSIADRAPVVRTVPGRQAISCRPQAAAAPPWRRPDQRHPHGRRPYQVGQGAGRVEHRGSDAAVGARDSRRTAPY